MQMMKKDGELYIKLYNEASNLQHLTFYIGQLLQSMTLKISQFQPEDHSWLIASESSYFGWFHSAELSYVGYSK